MKPPNRCYPAARVLSVASGACGSPLAPASLARRSVAVVAASGVPVRLAWSRRRRGPLGPPRPVRGRRSPWPSVLAGPSLSLASRPASWPAGSWAAWLAWMGWRTRSPSQPTQATFNKSTTRQLQRPRPALRTTPRRNSQTAGRTHVPRSPQTHATGTAQMRENSTSQASTSRSG